MEMLAQNKELVKSVIRDNRYYKGLRFAGSLLQGKVTFWKDEDRIIIFRLSDDWVRVTDITKGCF